MECMDDGKAWKTEPFLRSSKHVERLEEREVMHFRMVQPPPSRSPFKYSPVHLGKSPFKTPKAENKHSGAKSGNSPVA